MEHRVFAVERRWSAGFCSADVLRQQSEEKARAFSGHRSQLSDSTSIGPSFDRTIW
jgi:hypothetical protein